MSGLDKNRKRNQTICFRMTPEERRQLYARIAVSGLPKSTYMIHSVLHQHVEITAGKYQSDRLSLELKRLRGQLERTRVEKEKIALLEDCKALLEQVINLTEKDVLP